jgi:geranylgeranyl pyrophosphate synthase
VTAASLDLDAWMALRRAQVDALLDRRLPLPSEDPGRLVEAMRYSLLAPGKRLRPLLALGAAEAVSAGRLAHQSQPGRAVLGPPEPVAIAAATVELVHCYSLIHDDLPAMDDDDLRRGRPSCHKAFGEATAILAGDALLTLAFEWMADAALASDEPARYVAATRALARAAGPVGMVRGQARDLGEPPPADLTGLETLHREKTGALFRAAVAVGALAAGASAPQVAALDAFADAFGLAFQHADDLDDAEHAAHAAEARRRTAALAEAALAALAPFGEAAAPLRGMALALVGRATARRC